MDRSEEFRPGPKGQDGVLNLVLLQFVELAAGVQEIQRTKKAGKLPLKIRR